LLKNPIKKLIKSKGLKVVEFVRAARISRSYIYCIFNGKYPSRKLMRRIARVLGVSVEELFPLLKRMKAKINETFIRKLMTQLGCGQNELARKIGIEHGTLSNILSGKRGLGDSTLSKLYQVFPEILES